MRIHINGYYLAGDPSKTEHEHSSAGNFHMTPGRRQEQVQGWGWSHTQQFDRGNQAWLVEFDTTRRFDSFEAMQEFMFTMDTAHDWSGTVSFREDTAPAGTWAEFDLTNCTIDPPVMYPMGVTLRLSYRIVGGERSAKRSGVYGARLTEDGEDRLTEDGSIRTREEEPVA